MLHAKNHNVSVIPVFLIRILLEMYFYCAIIKVKIILEDFMKRFVSFLLALFLMWAVIPFGVLQTSAASVAELRQAAVDYMFKMASVKWTATASFTTGGRGSYSFVKGNTYYGIPYCWGCGKCNYKVLNYEKFVSAMSASNNTISKCIGRNDCSSSVSSSWATIDKNVKGNLNTKSMRPWYSSTDSIISVGNYSYGSTCKNTCTKNGSKVIYAAYDCLQAGDAILRDGHVKMVVSVDKKNKKITVIEQTGAGYTYNPSTKKTTDHSGSVSNSKHNSTWDVLDVMSYKLAFDNGYIPITCKALSTGTGTNYSVSSVSSSNITNAGAKITAALNVSAYNVQQWSYCIGTSQSDVSKANANTETVRAINYGGYKTAKTESFYITKFKGAALKPNTTYFYKVIVKIEGKNYTSGIFKFTTANSLPSSTSVTVDSGYTDIAVGDQVKISWQEAKGAQKYNIIVKDSKGNTVQTKNNVAGLTAVLDGFKSAGSYTLQIFSVNTAGTTPGGSAVITVHPDVTVTFFDPISNQNIAVINVPYGHDADAPKNPQQKGHTFSKWDREFCDVTEDITVNAVYDVNSYTIKFRTRIDGEENFVSQQTVKFGDTVVPPVISAPIGYAFVGWDKPLDNVQSDMTVTAVFKWADTENAALVTVDSTQRSATEHGYDVTVTVSNKVEKTIDGRIVVVLKSNDGTMLTKAESAGFTIQASKKYTNTVTVLYNDLAPIVEVYVIGAYETLGQLAKPVSTDIDNTTITTEWSEWIEFTGECPVTSTDELTVEIEDTGKVSQEKKFFRYQTKITSKQTSIDGYTRGDYTLVANSTGSVSYADKWRSGFNTSHSLYKQYNVTPKTAYETTTQKLVIDSTKLQGYIYYHWCRGDNVGAINRKISSDKTSTYDTFHAFYSTTPIPFTASANAYKYKNTSICKDTYWWMPMSATNSATTKVYKQTYTLYDKVYDYFSPYGSWTQYDCSSVELAVKLAMLGAENVEYKTEPGEKIFRYRYSYNIDSKFDNSQIKEPDAHSDRIYDLEGTVSKEFAGKTATVWVYKNKEASNSNTEYVGTAAVSADGKISIKNAVLREAPTVQTGDFTVACVVSGQETAIEIGKILSPLPQYTVKFYDFDRTTIISEQVVTHGQNAALPDKKMLNVPNGSRFTNWSESVVNVRSDMNVFPESETVECVVAYVNWETQQVELMIYSYGSKLLPNGIAQGKEGYVTEWVVQDGDGYLTIDEFNSAGKTVTGHMAVVTRSTPIKYQVGFVNIPLDAPVPETDVLDFIQSCEVADQYEAEHGSYIDFSKVEGMEDTDNYTFHGWINAYTGKPLDSTVASEDLLLYPDISFAEATENPVADVATGTYTQNQILSLSCDTEDAVIRYTLDGSDPKTSDTALIYSSPIELTSSCILRMYASSQGRDDSEEVAEYYAINTADNPVYCLVYISVTENDDSEKPTVLLIENGKKISIDQIPQVEGHDFEDLYLDPELCLGFDIDSAVTSDLFLYASYTAHIHTVVFTDHDGKILSVVGVEHGLSAPQPKNPTRDDYVFVGWDGDVEHITGPVTFAAVYVHKSEYIPDVIKGDVNGNNTIDTPDYIMAKRAVLGTYSPTEEQVVAADLNDNGVIDTSDYAKIKRHVLGSYVIG